MKEEHMTEKDALIEINTTLKKIEDAIYVVAGILEDRMSSEK